MALDGSAGEKCLGKHLISWEDKMRISKQNIGSTGAVKVRTSIHFVALVNKKTLQDLKGCYNRLHCGTQGSIIKLFEKDSGKERNTSEKRQ